MDFESLQKYCLSFPGVTEQVQWVEHILFKVGGKMFVIYNLNNAYPNRFSIKCSEENFVMLTERENIIPAPYLAHNKWVNFQDGFRMSQGELEELIAESYNLIFSKLPKRVQREINGEAPEVKSAKKIVKKSSAKIISAKSKSTVKTKSKK